MKTTGQGSTFSLSSSSSDNKKLKYEVMCVSAYLMPFIMYTLWHAGAAALLGSQVDQGCGSVFKTLCSYACV